MKISILELQKLFKVIEKKNISIAGVIDLIKNKPIEKAVTMVITMAIGDRTYEVLGCLREGEASVTGHTLLKRAKEMRTNLGENDGQYILNHQDEIPPAFRGKIIFVFLGWHYSGDPGRPYYISWNGDKWVRGRRSLSYNGWDSRIRLLRYK